MGLNFYDAWTICKANKGMSLEDYWWLNSGEDEYEKCHIRYLIESGKQTYFGRPVQHYLKIKLAKLITNKSLISKKLGKR